MTGYDLAAIAVAVVAVIVSLLAAKWSSDDRKAANDLVAEANAKLDESNRIAREAIEMDRRANEMMGEANKLTVEANRMISEANDMTRASAARDQKRFENEELDRAKANALRKFTSFRVTWSDDVILIQNVGGANATDVAWTVRSSLGRDFGVKGEPSSTARILSGDVWRFHYPMSMGMGTIYFAMSWQDLGSSVRTECAEQELPRNNPITFSL